MPNVEKLVRNARSLVSEFDAECGKPLDGKNPGATREWRDRLRNARNKFDMVQGWPAGVLECVEQLDKRIADLRRVLNESNPGRTPPRHTLSWGDLLKNATPTPSSPALKRKFESPTPVVAKKRARMSVPLETPSRPVAGTSKTVSVKPGKRRVSSEGKQRLAGGTNGTVETRVLESATESIDAEPAGKRATMPDFAEMEVDQPLLSRGDKQVFLKNDTGKEGLQLPGLWSPGGDDERSETELGLFDNGRENLDQLKENMVVLVHCEKCRNCKQRTCTHIVDVDSGNGSRCTLCAEEDIHLYSCDWAVRVANPLLSPEGCSDTVGRAEPGPAVVVRSPDIQTPASISPISKPREAAPATNSSACVFQLKAASAMDALPITDGTEPQRPVLASLTSTISHVSALAASSSASKSKFKMKCAPHGSTLEDIFKTYAARYDLHDVDVAEVDLVQSFFCANKDGLEPLINALCKMKQEHSKRRDEIEREARQVRREVERLEVLVKGLQQNIDRLDKRAEQEERLYKFYADAVLQLQGMKSN